MRIYQALNVELTYQNYGSTWALILRGSEQDIELAFNGLYNWGVSNGEVEYQDGMHTVGVVWSDPQSVEKFFELTALNNLLNTTPFDRSINFRQRGYSKLLAANLKKAAKEMARQKIATLRLNHESFFKTGKKRNIMPTEYSMGTLTAERPDSDFKDSVYSYAFRDNSPEFDREKQTHFVHNT